MLAMRGPSGSGHSRMLDACALEGKLLGAAVVRLDARDALSGHWGVARALGNQLVALFPQQAADAARLSRSVLGHIIEDLLVDDATGVTAYAPERSLIIREFRDWVYSISKSQRLVIIVDDVERLDEPSVALLSAIAARVERHPILLALTFASDAKSVPPTLQLIDELSHSIQLEQLDPSQTEALLKSVFGDGPNLHACAVRIHGLSYGNPRTVMELAQHLVDTNQAHYEAGSWALPARLAHNDLPNTLSASLLARLTELSADARELADGLALSDQDELTMAQHVELSSHRDNARVFRAQGELVAARILISDGDRMLFAQRGFLPVVQQVMPEQRRRELHERIAAILANESSSEVRRCHHLLEAGRDDEAISTLLRLEVGTQPPPVTLWQAALERAERAGMPAATLHGLRMGILLAAPYAMDYSAFRQTAPAVLARLDEESGLAQYRQLSDLPEAERLQRALATAQQLYASRPPHERVYPPIGAIRELARLIAAISAMSAPVFDLEQLESLPTLEPYFPLSPSLIVIARVVEGTREWISGRFRHSRKIFEDILIRIAEPDRGGLDSTQYERMRLALQYILATLEAGSGIEAAERRIQLLDQHRGTRIAAWRVRQLLQMALGNTTEAEKHARRAAVLEAQQGATERNMNVTAGMELVLHARLGDLLGVKACVETLEKLSALHQGWRPIELLGRSLYCQLQGDPAAALRFVLAGLELAPPRRHSFFSELARTHLSVLNDLGRRDEALQMARHYISVCAQHDLRPDPSVYGSVLFAQAGWIDEAVRTITPIIESAESLGCAGLVLGTLYTARCRIALAARDGVGARHWFDRATEQYEKANNPRLNAELVQILDEAIAQGLPLRDQDSGLRQALTSFAPAKEQDTVHSRIAECIDNADRARCALTLLMERLLGSVGYLYVRSTGGTPSLIAALPDPPGDTEVQAWVDRYAHAWLARASANDSDDTTVVDEETASGTDTQSETIATATDDEEPVSDVSSYVDDEGRALEAMLLTAGQGRDQRLAAILVVASVRGQRATVPYALSSTLARELLEYGDSVGWQ